MRVEEVRQLDEPERRREQEQQPQRQHVRRRAQQEHRQALEGPGGERPRARRAPDAAQHPGDHRHHHAAGQQEQVGPQAVEPRLLEVRPAHAEVQQLVLDVLPRPREHRLAAVALGAQHPDHPVRRDRRQQQRDRPEGDPADDEADHLATERERIRGSSRTMAMSASRLSATISTDAHSASACSVA